MTPERGRLVPLPRVSTEHFQDHTQFRRTAATLELTMIIGVPKEIKNNEFRVAITAAGVHEFRSNGHTVLV